MTRMSLEEIDCRVRYFIVCGIDNSWIYQYWKQWGDKFFRFLKEFFFSKVYMIYDSVVHVLIYLAQYNICFTSLLPTCTDKMSHRNIKRLIKKREKNCQTI